jgi:hypothetical protein
MNWQHSLILGSAEAVVTNLTDQAMATRDLARRARRRASTLTDVEDVTRLLRYAEELDAQAADIDRRAKEGG